MKIKQSKYWKLIIFLIVVVVATISCSDNDQDTIIDTPKEMAEPILKETVIDVFPNNTPCQIANLIRGISDNSSMNRYKLLIHDGEYEEIDILTKDYVDLEGEHQDKVTLFCDADATYNAPENYTLASQYSGMPVNEIPWKWKHVIIHSSNSVVRNLTLETRGGVCKYICHQDGVKNKGTAVFEKCIFKENTGSSILGVGIYADQFYKYKDCVFLTSVRSLAAIRRNTFNLHTWDNQEAPCGVVFENCIFYNTGHILVTELGSGQSDFWEFINCSTDKPENTFVRFAGFNENTPYNMILRVVGGGQFTSCTRRIKKGCQTQYSEQRHYACSKSWRLSFWNGAG